MPSSNPYIISVSNDPSLTGDAMVSDVLLGKTFYSNSMVQKIGTMPNNGGVDITLPLNGSYTIPQGWHSGSGSVHQSLPSSVVNTADSTATANKILLGDTAYVNGSKITGTIPIQNATTITPTTIDQTIAWGRYLGGSQTIKGDADLIPVNIKNGVDIFGVVGSYEGMSGLQIAKKITGKFSAPWNPDSHTITLPQSVDISKCTVILSIDPIPAAMYYAWISSYSLTSTTLTFSKAKDGTSPYPNISVYYEVIEYVNAKSIQRGVMAFNNSISISSVDIDKSVVICSPAGAATMTNVTIQETSSSSVYLESSTILRNNYKCGILAMGRACWNVIEFN